MVYKYIIVNTVYKGDNKHDDDDDDDDNNNNNNNNRKNTEFRVLHCFNFRS